ncbi:hypothetical protein MKFW12EY_44550 (plasmid) [Methylomonas koyamae]|nr:hypothetical protein MKFW12EY_44550 [Methylomonas koyamae]
MGFDESTQGIRIVEHAFLILGNVRYKFLDVTKPRLCEGCFRFIWCIFDAVLKKLWCLVLERIASREWTNTIEVFLSVLSESRSSHVFNKPLNFNGSEICKPIHLYFGGS